MRTTLTLDDDVLLAAKAMAEREQRSLGAVLSDLARQGLKRPAGKAQVRNGIPLLARKPGSAPVTLELVNQLRDEQG